MRFLRLDRLSGIYLFVVFLVLFGLWTPDTFLSQSTLHSVASQQAVAGIVAIALLIPFTCGEYDLSVGSLANFTGILAMETQSNWHWGWEVSALVAVVLGVLVGCFNAFVVVRLRVNSFIGTLAMGSILSAFQVIVTGGNQPNPIVTPGWQNFTQYKIFGFQIVVLYMLVICVIAWWLLQHTPVGRSFYAIGGNTEAARLSGIRVDRRRGLSLILSAGIASVAGVFYTSLSGPSLSFGAGLLLPAFAAVYLGSTQLLPGKFNVWGSLLSIFVLATGVEGFQLVSGKQWLPDMFNGVALIIAVAVAVNQFRSGGRRIRRKGDQADLTAPDGTPLAEKVTTPVAEPSQVSVAGPSQV